MQLDPVTELEALVDVLERASLPYALCGGLALAVHGHARATLDIDLLVPGDSVGAIIAAAKTAGFDIPARKMIFGLRSGMPREVQRISKLDPATGALLALDLIVVTPALEEVWATRVVVQAGPRRMTVVSAQGLATMKRIAGRPQDLADLARLEGTDDGGDDDAP